MTYKELYMLQVGSLIYKEGTNKIFNVTEFHTIGDIEEIERVSMESGSNSEPLFFRVRLNRLSEWKIFDPLDGLMLVKFIVNQKTTPIVVYKTFNIKTSQSELQAYSLHLHTKHWMDISDIYAEHDYYPVLEEDPVFEESNPVAPQKKTSERVKMSMEFSISGYLDDYALDKFRFAIGDVLQKFTHSYTDERDNKEKQLEINRTSTWEGINAKFVKTNNYDQ